MRLGGKSRVEMIRLARRLGASVRQVPATGELEIYHPLAGCARISANRKDAPRSLIRLIRRAERRPSSHVRGRNRHVASTDSSSS